MVNVNREDKRLCVLGGEGPATGTPRAFGILSGDDKPVGRTVTKAARPHFPLRDFCVHTYFTLLQLFVKKVHAVDLGRLATCTSFPGVHGH